MVLGLMGGLGIQRLYFFREEGGKRESRTGEFV